MYDNLSTRFRNVARSCRGLATIMVEESAARRVEGRFRGSWIAYCALYLDSFLSPPTNKRNNQRAENAEARMPLPLAIARKLTKIWPADRPLFVRRSAVERNTAGVSSIEFAKRVAAIGVDVIHRSSGRSGRSRPGDFGGIRIPRSAELPLRRLNRHGRLLKRW